MQSNVAAGARARGAWPSLERSPAPQSVEANAKVAAVAPLEAQTQEAASLDLARSEAKQRRDPEQTMHRGGTFMTGTEE